MLTFGIESVELVPLIFTFKLLFSINAFSVSGFTSPFKIKLLLYFQSYWWTYVQGNNRDADKENRHKHHEDLILSHKEGLRTFVDEGGDLSHTVCACVLTGYFSGKRGGKEQRRNTQNGGEEGKFDHKMLSFFLVS